MRTVKKIEVRARKDGSIQCISCSGTVINGICNICGGYTAELFYEHDAKKDFGRYKRALEERLRRNNYNIQISKYPRTVEALFDRQIDISEAYRIIVNKIKMAAEREQLRKNMEHDERYSALVEVNTIGRTRKNIMEAYNEYKENDMF